MKIKDGSLQLHVLHYYANFDVTHQLNQNEFAKLFISTSSLHTEKEEGKGMNEIMGGELQVFTYIYIYMCVEKKGGRSLLKGKRCKTYFLFPNTVGNASFLSLTSLSLDQL